MLIKKDVRYWTESERNYLDIFLPEQEVKGVYIYIHGGGITSGDKECISDAQVNRLTSGGIAVVCPSYRLYPNAKYPEFIEDVAAVAAWVKNHPEEVKGCSDVFIGGSSAGGYLSMMLYFDNTYLGKYGLSCKDFAGFVFDAGQPTTHFNVVGERGLDTRRVIVDEAAPLFHIKEYSGEPPMQIFVADNDMENRYEQTILLLSTLKHFHYPQDIITYVCKENCTHCCYLADDEYAEEVYGFIAKTQASKV